MRQRRFSDLEFVNTHGAKVPLAALRDGHYVYRFFAANGALLYVGYTKNLAHRFHGHKTTKSWWHEVASVEVRLFDDSTAALQHERHAIRTERPHHNGAPRGTQLRNARQLIGRGVV